MVQQRGDNGPVHVAPPQHFVDHPPHGIGAIAIKPSRLSSNGSAIGSANFHKFKCHCQNPQQK
jgi:hypothetical protein